MKFLQLQLPVLVTLTCLTACTPSGGALRSRAAQFAAQEESPLGSKDLVIDSERISTHIAAPNQADAASQAVDAANRANLLNDAEAAAPTAMTTDDNSTDAATQSDAEYGSAEAGDTDVTDADELDAMDDPGIPMETSDDTSVAESVTQDTSPIVHAGDVTNGTTTVDELDADSEPRKKDKKDKSKQDKKGKKDNNEKSKPDKGKKKENGALASAEPVHLAFITSAAYSGNLAASFQEQSFRSGYEGADARCTWHAAQAGLGGRWLAAISGHPMLLLLDPSSAVNDLHNERIVSRVPFLLAEDARLNVALVTDEHGEKIQRRPFAWSPTGSRSGEDQECDQWRSDSSTDFGVYGNTRRAAKSSSLKMRGKLARCDHSLRLICISESPYP